MQRGYQHWAGASGAACLVGFAHLRGGRSARGSDDYHFKPRPACLCEQSRWSQATGQSLRCCPAHRVTFGKEQFSPLLGRGGGCGVLQVLARLQATLTSQEYWRGATGAGGAFGSKRGSSGASRRARAERGAVSG